VRLPTSKNKENSRVAAFPAHAAISRKLHAGRYAACCRGSVRCERLRHGSCRSGVWAGRHPAGVGAGTATVIVRVCDDVSGLGSRGGRDISGGVGQAIRGCAGGDCGLLRPA
jgi:hypothetical protein